MAWHGLAAFIAGMHVKKIKAIFSTLLLNMPGSVCQVQAQEKKKSAGQILAS